MITGLKFLFTSTELIHHFLKQAEYHDRRAEQKEEELPRIREVAKHQAEDQAVARRMSEAYGTSYNQRDIVAEAERYIATKRRKAEEYRILAKHVVHDDSYLLAIAELQQVELLRV